MTVSPRVIVATLHADLRQHNIRKDNEQDCCAKAQEVIFHDHCPVTYITKHACTTCDGVKACLT